MRLYAHKLVKRGGYSTDNPAWINRITKEGKDGELEEIWLVWLPSYGMEYQINYDEYVWSQRGIYWNLATGKKGKISKRVENWAMR